MWTGFKKTTCIAALACTVSATQASEVSAQDAPAYDPLKRTVSPVKFRLRGIFHGASTVTSPSDERKDRVSDPFVLSYLKDDAASDEVLAMRGALFGTIRVDNPAGVSPSVASYAFGVVVNQAEVNGQKTQNTIEFKVGGAWLFGNSRPNAVLTSHYLSADLGWLTDSDFDLSVFTANARYEPFGTTRGFAGAPYTTGNFSFELRPALEMQYQHVENADGRAAFLDEEDRLYAGVSLVARAGFIKGPLERLSFDAEYKAFEDVLGSAPSTELVTAGINWALDDNGHAVLRLGVEHGETPTQNFSDKVTVGLGFSF